MKIVKNGGTIWGDQFAQLVKERLGEEAPILYEVGAFDGRDVDQFLQVLPKTTAIAFEASPVTFQSYLMDKPYRTINCAVCDDNGSVEFHESKDRPTSSIRVGTHPLKTVHVPGVRLDELIREGTIPLADVIKIDAEGCAYEVLKGLGKYIQDVQMLYIETEDKQFWEGQHLHDEVVELLKPYFQCILLHDNNHQFDSVWVQK